MVIWEDVIDFVLDLIELFLKEEFVIIVEFFVELILLCRKIDFDVCSVVGLVDVVIVFKGDGFVWWKRKYYFDVNFNLDFFVWRDVSGVDDED